MSAPAADRTAGGSGVVSIAAWLPAATYVVLGGVFLWNYRHYLDSDAAVYLDIARLWAEGRFREAVVGYWGPLLPWLVAVPVALGVPLVLAGKAVCFAIGLAWVLSVQRFLRGVAGPRAAVAGSLLGAVPATLVVGVPYMVLPDALLGIVCLLILRVLLDHVRRPRAATAIAAGALCGLTYLCKSPAWILTLGPVLLALAWGAWLSRRRDGRAFARAAAHGAAVVAVAAAIILAWAVPLSVRTGKPTLGSSSNFLLGHVYHRAGYPAPKAVRRVPYDGERWILHNPWALERVGPVRFQWRFHAVEAAHNFRRAAPFFAACPVALLGIALGIARTRRCLRSRRHAVLWWFTAWMTALLWTRTLETRWFLYFAPAMLAAGLRFPLPRALRRLGATRRRMALVAAVVACAAVLRWWPVRPLGVARARHAAELRTRLRGDERAWCNRTAAGIPVAFLLDVRMSPGSPLADERRPGVEPADLVIWSHDPGDSRTDIDVSRMPGYVPAADWFEEDGLHVTVLRRSP